MYIMVALAALKNSAFREGDVCENRRTEIQMSWYLFPSATFIFTPVYKRLRMSSTTSVVVAVPPKSGLRSLPSSRFPSTAA